MEGASLVHTNVMETKTVRTDLMKQMKFAIIGNVTRKQNFHARTENVSLSCGNVILITIVATIAMNQLIFAVIKTVLLVGVVVQVMLIIVASLNGCIVMEKMIAVMVRMS